MCKLALRDTCFQPAEKIQKKYGDLPGEVLLIELQKGSNGLGLSLAGNKDRTRMSVFVCGLNPQGNAFKDGRIRTGDEILEVSGGWGGVPRRGRGRLTGS